MLRLKCAKFNFGSTPDPVEEAHGASPQSTSISGFRGPLRGREREEMEWEREGKKGKRGRKGTGEEGRAVIGRGEKERKERMNGRTGGKGKELKCNGVRRKS